MIDKINSYKELAMQADKDAEGVSRWERLFLQPLEQKYNTMSQQINDKASYDISQAYANYKKQQQSLNLASNLGTGFKESVSDSLYDTYNQDYQLIRGNQMANLYELQDQKLAEMEEADEALTAFATNMSKIEDLIYQYKGINANNLTKNEADGGYGFYEYKDGYYTLTDKGRNFFNETLYNPDDLDKTFSKYLYDEDEDLYNFYVQNQSDINEMIAGLDRDQRGFDAELSEKIKTEDYSKLVNEAKSRNDNISDVGTLTDSWILKNASYNINGDVYRLAATTKSLDKELSSKIDRKGLVRGDIVTYNGVKYMYDPKQTYKFRRWLRLYK